MTGSKSTDKRDKILSEIDRAASYESRYLGSEPYLPLEVLHKLNDQDYSYHQDGVFLIRNEEFDERDTALSGVWFPIIELGHPKFSGFILDGDSDVAFNDLGDAINFYRSFLKGKSIHIEVPEKPFLFNGVRYSLSTNFSNIYEINVEANISRNYYISYEFIDSNHCWIISNHNGFELSPVFVLCNKKDDLPILGFAEVFSYCSFVLKASRIVLRVPSINSIGFFPLI